MAQPPDVRLGGPERDWRAFAALNQMTNHWDRPDWHPGRTAYYWYLTFGDIDSLRTMAERCQTAMPVTSFDLIPPGDLHMTLERLAFCEDVDELVVERIVDVASHRCRKLTELEFSVGPLAGSRGALSFSVDPQEEIDRVRVELVRAMHQFGIALDVMPAAPFRPHIGIGYCNQEIDAQPIIAAVAGLRSLSPVPVRIGVVELVSLTRHQRSYEWATIAKLPLGRKP